MRARPLFHLELFEDHPFFARNVFFAESRVQHQIGEHVERPRQMLIENLSGKSNVLFCRESVELAADRVDRAGDVVG